MNIKKIIFNAFLLLVIAALLMLCVVSHAFDNWLTLIGMRREPATHVPADLNRKIHSQFADYIAEFLDFQSFLSREDDSMIANFGTYMDGYEE